MLLHKFESLKEAENTVGGLSAPSKMPSYAWSISARRCNVGSKLAKKEGTVCYNCYALKGRYMFNNTQNALERRFNAWSDNREKFVDAMVYIMHNKQHIKDKGVFRWFDSGDLQGLPMLEDINNIAWASPHVKFWLPTKEYTLIKDQSLEIAPNLIIRVSNPNKNKSFKDSFDYVSAVFEKDFIIPKDSYMCPSSKQGNVCGSCRACWNSKIEEVVYLAH